MGFESDVVESEMEWATAEVAAALSTDDQDDQLGLPGLETVLAFVAVKLVVPAIASFAGRLLYDKYKDITTSRQAREALQALVRDGDYDASAGTVDEREVVDHLIAIARSEGISEAKARRLANELVRRAKHISGR